MTDITTTALVPLHVVAPEVGLSVWTLRRYVVAGDIPARTLASRGMYVERHWLQKLTGTSHRYTGPLLLSPRDAAAWLGVHPQTLRAAIRRGNVPTELDGRYLPGRFLRQLIEGDPSSRLAQTPNHYPDRVVR